MENDIDDNSMRKIDDSSDDYDNVRAKKRNKLSLKNSLPRYARHKLH